MVWDLLFAVFGIVATGVALRSRTRHTAVTAILILLPLQEIARPVRVLATVLILGLFFAELLQRALLKRPLEIAPAVLALPAAIFLSLALNPTLEHPYSRLKASGIFLSYLGALAVFQLLWWTIRDARDAVKVVRRFTIFVLICCGLGVLIASAGLTETIADLQAELQAEAGLPVFSERQFLFFRHPNQNAYFSAFGLIFLLSRFLTRRRKTRSVPASNPGLGFDSPEQRQGISPETLVRRQWKERRRDRWLQLALVLGFIVCLVNFALTGSRGAILALPMAVLAALFLAGRLRLAVTSTFALMILIPFVVIFLIGIGTGEAASTEGEALTSRLRDLTNPSSALRTRPILWSGAFGAFLQKPMLGVGPTNLSYYFLYETPAMLTWSEEFLSTAPAHNLYLHLLATTGVVGLCAFFVLVFHLLLRLRPTTRSTAARESQELAFSGLIALLFLLIVGLLGHTVLGIYYFNTSIFYAIFALALIGCARPPREPQDVRV